MKDHVKEQLFRDGNQRWSVARLITLAKDLDPFEIPLKHLNICYLYPKPKSTLDFVEHMRQVLEADLSFPIILDEEGFCMDGRHRVCRALLEKKETILAVRFEKTPMCCILLTTNF